MVFYESIPRELSHNILDSAFFPLMWVTGVIGIFFLHGTTCPACGKSFTQHEKRWYGNLFSLKCVNCGERMFVKSTDKQ